MNTALYKFSVIKDVISDVVFKDQFSRLPIMLAFTELLNLPLFAPSRYCKDRPINNNYRSQRTVCVTVKLQDSTVLLLYAFFPSRSVGSTLDAQLVFFSHSCLFHSPFQKRSISYYGLYTLYLISCVERAFHIIFDHSYYIGSWKLLRTLACNTSFLSVCTTEPSFSKRFSNKAPYHTHGFVLLKRMRPIIFRLWYNRAEMHHYKYF